MLRGMDEHHLCFKIAIENISQPFCALLPLEHPQRNLQQGL
jgi:hypothetical protein